MRLVFLSQVIPVPPAGGESLRSYGLLRCFQNLGYSVTAVIPQAGDTMEFKERFPNVELIPYSFPVNRSLPGQFIGYFKKDIKLSALLSRIIEREKPDLAFIDYFFLGQYIGEFQSAGIPVIYGTHNAQAKLRLQQPASGLIQRLIRRFAFIAQSWHERRYFPHADHLVCVSENDRHYHRAFLDKNKISVVPNFLDESLYKPTGQKGDYIIMTGNFHSFQNFFGLKWFTEEVWNESMDKEYRLLVAGRGAATVAGKLRLDERYDYVEIIEQPEDMVTLISRARASVVPLWHGSGTRLKCIEAMALKTQLISTSIGAEGIQHEGSILIADDPGRFREYLREVMNGQKDLTEEAYRVFIKDHSIGANQARLGAIVEKVI